MLLLLFLYNWALLICGQVSYNFGVSFTVPGISVYLGNLALSRALGDFIFKKNDSKRPEEQIVTG